MSDPGWHPDPEDPAQVRYWDGAQWTEHRSPNPNYAPPPPPPGAPAPFAAQQPPPVKKKSKAPWILGGIAAVLVVGIVSCVALIGGAAKGVSDELNKGDDKVVSSGASTDGSATQTPETSAATASTVPTTPPVAAGPAAPDASPFVAGFGDLSVVSLPPGDPGKLSIVSTGARDELNDAVTIIVRNNTSDPIGQIEATGTARDSAGALVGSGSSQGFKPAIVAPGEIAYGYVYFSGGFPGGSTFEFSVSGEEVGTYFRPITITELNNTGEAIIGAVSNETGVDVTGPISVDVLCFAADGTTIGPKSGFAEQSDLLKGATGSFSIDLYKNECPIGLAASSAYGSL